MAALCAAAVAQERAALDETTIIEGAIILSRSLKDQSLMGRQARLFRHHIKLIFGA